MLGRQLLGNGLFVSGAILIGSLALLALAAPGLTRAGVMRHPTEQSAEGLDGDGMPLGPSRRFVLGTDQLGRDVLSRVLHGARVSLAVGVAAMLAATVVGVAVGVVAGFYGKAIDEALMGLTEIMMTIPALLLAIAFARLMDGKEIRLLPAWPHWGFLDDYLTVTLKPGMASIGLVIGFVSWTGIVRVVRGQVMSLKEREFIVAARAVGARNGRLIFRHILPNVMPTIIVLAAMSTAGTILLEAGLSYLGISVPPPAPTWGNMIAEGQPYFIAAPHVVIVPGVAIVLTVLGFNLLGQGLQDVLDPFQKGRGR